MSDPLPTCWQESVKESVKGLARESHIPCKTKVMGGHIGNAWYIALLTFLQLRDRSELE